ncbi:DUF6886 family protein [Amycolatopsis saalfeldensis]|uniref:DUF6886 family protein n=1 Tax=Amycolatopsis saalfeldensis TaxID=394193 RepID=UPI0031831F1B
MRPAGRFVFAHWTAARPTGAATGTARQPDAFVWAVDGERAPAYWFPCACPRVMAWTTPSTTPEDCARILGPGDATRTHAIEYAWLDRMRTVHLSAYRLPADALTPHDSPVFALPSRGCSPPGRSRVRRRGANYTLGVSRETRASWSR